VEREESLPPELEQQIAALAAEDDEMLWAMLRGRFAPAKSARLEELHLQCQAGDWDEERAQEAEQLATEMEEYMLLRAQAMFLLMQRGHDPAKILEQLQIVEVWE
jgi:hypothetical protein